MWLPGLGSGVSDSAELRVVPGRIAVNDVDCIVDLPEVKIWEVDLRTKYAVIISLAYGGTGADGSSDREMTVVLGADEHTLKLDTSVSRPWTDLVWTRPPGPAWDLLADCARYTVRVVAWQRPGYK